MATRVALNSSFPPNVKPAKLFANEVLVFPKVCLPEASAHADRRPGSSLLAVLRATGTGASRLHQYDWPTLFKQPSLLRQAPIHNGPQQQTTTATPTTKNGPQEAANTMQNGLHLGAGFSKAVSGTQP